VHGIQVFLKLTIDNYVSDLIDEVNGSLPINAIANVDANQEENGTTAPPKIKLKKRMIGTKTMK
jgi:hypothetical protein